MIGHHRLRGRDEKTVEVAGTDGASRAMFNNAPWDDDKPYAAAKALEETLEASRGLDKFLTASVVLEEPKQEVNMSNKLSAFVDEVETGLKDLEDHVDELMPRFRNAMAKGKEHMTRFQGHVDRAEAAIKKVEEFNNKAEGSNQ
jgi:hypothetical protein